jgi:hypothetical protein
MQLFQNMWYEKFPFGLHLQSHGRAPRVLRIELQPFSLQTPDLLKRFAVTLGQKVLENNMKPGA